MLRNRLLLAIDRAEAGEAAVDYTIGHAAQYGAEVVVLHVRAMPPSLRVPPLDTVDAARELVTAALLQMRDAGVHGSGLVTTAREDTVAERIVQIATDERCDAIILGSRRTRGLRRLSGTRLRERVVRISHLPVIVAPPFLRYTARELTSALEAVEVPT